MHDFSSHQQLGENNFCIIGYYLWQQLSMPVLRNVNIGRHSERLGSHTPVIYDGKLDPLCES
jgi:hypothetical protein